MEDLANEFSSYAMIEDIGSAPCGLQKPLVKKPSSDALEEPKFPSYKSKLSYSMNPILPSTTQISSSTAKKNTPKTTTKHRYSTRSSSILLKSTSLVLSDSESTLSDDAKSVGGNFFNDRKQPTRVKKSKRKKADKDDVQLYPYIPICNSDQYYGKRKRSTTITQNSYEHSCTGSQMSNYTANKLKKNEFNGVPMQCDFDNSKTSKLNKFDQQNENKIELDEEDSTSTLSEESNLSDPRFLDADDEQSDYYEVSNFQKKNNHRRQYGRTSLEKTNNPFSVLSSTSSTSPSTSSSLWKRRRRNLPNNHFN